MVTRVYCYVDGESHYLRSEEAWQGLHGPEARLQHLRYHFQPASNAILLLPKAKVFWTVKLSPNQRTRYVTAVAGDQSAIHSVNVKLNEFGLEPVVLQERRQLANQRDNLLKAQKLIEKPKQVDAAIFSQMLEDAHEDLYDICNLFTSDVDYVPVIEALKRRGKTVFVHGYKDGLADQSPLEYVPHKFIDLTETLRTECRCVPMNDSNET